MGMLKRMKDMRDMVNAAPGMVAQAQQLGAQAQQMAAAQQAAMQAQAGAVAPGAAPAGTVPAGADFEPIAGVSLDQFVAVSKGVAPFGYDQSKLVEVAASHGISAADWAAAHTGWNERIHRNRAVAQRFNQIYRGV
jgi:hypothetical protein